MNLEKILQRIRNLFKEHYIYEKEVLIKSIEVTGKDILENKLMLH